MTEQRIAEIKQQARKESPYVVRELPHGRYDVGGPVESLTWGIDREHTMMNARHANDIHQAALIAERVKFEELIEALDHLAFNDDWTAAGMRMYAEDALSKFKQQKPTEG